MLNVLVGPDRIGTALAAGSCAFDAVGDKGRQVVVARVNGEVVDLSHELTEGDHVEAILISDPIGLSVLRHSVAHLVAQATQVVFPDVKLGIGPPTKDGFFYDFGTSRTFTPEDLVAIEKKCVEIVNSGQKFARRVTTREAARTELKPPVISFT